jgi:hypothetical protein
MYLNKQLMEYSTAFENSSTPFRFYQTNIVTEPDRAYFPYTNWFRGDYTSCTPIIADREAGFYPRMQTPITGCSREDDTKEDQLTHCFRGSTQQMRRCYTLDRTKDADTCGVTAKNGAVFDGKTFNDSKWVQTDPSYLGNKPILSYI